VAVGKVTLGKRKLKIQKSDRPEPKGKGRSLLIFWRAIRRNESTPFFIQVRPPKKGKHAAFYSGAPSKEMKARLF